MITLEQTAAYLRRYERFLILTHRRPDGDAVGCASALCLGLRALGKDAVIFPNPQFGAKFAPLLDDLLGTGDPHGRKLVSVDLAAESLLPYNALGLTGHTDLAIDHHASHTEYARKTYVDGTAAACGEIILDLLELLGVKLDKRMAEAIYVAVSTDTGRFCFSNTTAATFRAAAKCREAGADTASWGRLLFTVKTEGRRRVEAYLTAHTEVLADGRVAICTLPSAVVKELGATEDEMDDIAGFPRDLAGVEIGVMLRDVKDGARISLRTDEHWDASELCEALGGGGHKAAAGATVPGTLPDGRRAVLDVLRRFGAEV